MTSSAYETPETPREATDKAEGERACSVAAEMATFKHVCTGRDGKLCLFEDAHGHLVAVRAARLA